MILTITANPAVDVAYFVEKFEMGDIHRPLKTVATAGGKGLNVARVATVLGEKVTAMGFVGGSNGAFIQAEVNRLGIRNSFTEIAGETRRNTDIIDAAGKTGEILEAGPVITADEEARFFEQYTKEIKCHDFICASGSLPQGLDGEFYCRLIRTARENGKRILADTSGSALEKVLEAKPFMIKPNEDELSRLFGGDVDIKDALRRLYAEGIEVPLVTLGGNGAMFYDGEHFYRLVIPKIEIKNTVGSGDSTVAGIAVGLCRGMAVCDAVKLGMASGMANTQFEQTGTVSSELVERFYGQIRVEIL